MPCLAMMGEATGFVPKTVAVADFPQTITAGQSLYVNLEPPTGKTFKEGQTSAMLNQISPIVKFIASLGGVTERFNTDIPLDAGRYEFIVTGQYTDGTGFELRHQFTI